MGIEGFKQGLRKAKMAADEALDAITYRKRWPGTEAEYRMKTAELAHEIMYVDPAAELPPIPEEYDFAAGQLVLEKARQLVIEGKDADGRLMAIVDRLDDMIRGGIRKEEN